MSSRLPNESDDRQNSSNYHRDSSEANDASDASDGSDGQLAEESETNTSLISDPDLGCRFPIYVESMTAATFKLDVFSNDTILQIKQQLEYSEGIPVSQQRLIWKYEELVNDNTIRDCGIKNGSRLRLFIDLTTGPIITKAVDLSTSDNVTQKWSSGLDSEGRPVTLIILRKGDRIKLFSIGSGLSERDTSNYIREENDWTKAINAEMLDSKQEEDRQLKNKMNEIQNKLESLRLKRAKRNKNNSDDKRTDGNGSANSETIPNLNINSSNNSKDDINSILHLPPITIDSKSKETKTHLNYSNESSEFERRINLIKHILKPSIDKNTAPVERRRSLASLKTTNCDKGVNRLDLLSNNCDNNSICETRVTRRPLTAPVVSHVKHNGINVTNNLAKLSAQTQVRLEISLLPLINNNKTKRLNSGRRLPPIADNPKKKINKIRCSFCRNKLTIVNRFKCRSASICNSDQESRIQSQIYRQKQ